MIIRSLLKPTTIKVILGIIISGFSFMILFFLNVPFIPCISDSAQVLCTLTPLTDMEYYWASYAVLIVLFIIVPYLLACLVEYFFIQA